MTFYFNRHKTDYTKSQKGYQVDVPTGLATVLRAFFKEYDKKAGDSLFTNSSDEQWGEDQFTANIRKTLKKYTKKNVGINSLRHSKISDFLATNPTANSKRDLANAMGHSVQSEYSRLNEGDFIVEEKNKLKPEIEEQPKESIPDDKLVEI